MITNDEAIRASININYTKQKNSCNHNDYRSLYISNNLYYFFIASSTATATATVAPTIGLLPIPKKPIISTCAGTDEEPAN